MMHATGGLFWMPVYLLFFYLVVRKYKWNILWILLFAALMILVSDQLSTVVKELTHRLRPSQEPGLVVHLIDAYKGGMYGFYSAHASNFFSLAFFMIVLIGRFYRFFFIPVILWALLLAYTRIYLGVHYPGDIFAGMLVGCAIGLFAGKACRLTIASFPLGENKNTNH